MTLTEFLLARITEDEETVQAVRFSWPSRRDALADPKDPMYANLTRSLREAEAKRRIVEEHTPVDYGPLGMDSPNACHICGIDVGMSDWEYVRDSFPCVTLRALALPYADHPDYDEEWKP